MYGAGIKRVLKVQYRWVLSHVCYLTHSMNEHIADFPSTTLYNSELVSDSSVAKHTLLDLPTITDRDSDDAKDVLDHTVVFFDTAGCEFYERNEGDDTDKAKARIGEGSKSNENEATIVAKWARKLVRYPDVRLKSFTYPRSPSAFPPRRSVLLHRTRRKSPSCRLSSTKSSQR